MATRSSSAAVTYDHGATLLRIPGGAVHVSAIDDDTIVVDDFLLDARPVTVRRYARFLGAVGRHLPEPLDWATQLQTPESPVTGVGPDDAAAFAAFVGGRLPTVWEWQRVARNGVGLASVRFAEPFGVGGLCERWEWTATPAPAGFWVCGGRYRDRMELIPDADHIAFERGSAADVGFRVARDALPATITHLPPPFEPGPSGEPERTQVTPSSLSTTAPWPPEEPPDESAAEPAPPSPPPSPPAHADDVLAAMWAVRPQASWRCGDVVVLDVLREPGPIPEHEHRGIWLQPDGSRWPVALTAMWSTTTSSPRLEGRLQWHALREGRPPTEVCAFHVVDVRQGVMPVLVERALAGVRLRHFLDALAARDGGHLPLEVAVAFALHVVERSVLSTPVVSIGGLYRRGQLAWDGTWHPRFDIVEHDGRVMAGRHAAFLEMAPEAIAGRPLDERATVYRAGLLLYRLLAGVPPLIVADASNVMGFIRAAYDGERIPIRTQRPDLAVTVAAVIDDAIAIDREQRPGLDILLAQWRALLEPAFGHEADVVAPAQTAAFMAGLAAELFPRTREAQLTWWEEAALIDLDTAPLAHSATMLPLPTPSLERLHAALREAGNQEAART